MRLFRRTLLPGPGTGQADKISWEQVDRQDIQQWMVQLLHRYSGAYASIQFRALRQSPGGRSRST